MTTEQKARAYDEALNRAKEMCGALPTDEATMEYIFPELRESEDERIRKEAISIVQSYMNICDEEGDPCLSGYKVLAYLEKQKEQKPITESKRLANEVIEYLTKCGYSPVLKDDSKKEHFHIDIPRHEDDFWLSEEYKHCRSVLGEYYMEGDHGDDIYTLYVWREKKEQKPAEWSEGDERIIDTIISVLGQYIDYKTVSGTGSGYATPRYNKEIAWLKSLRPSWKPSKEQMNGLAHAINLDVYDAKRYGLDSLYNDLKKLM